MYPPNNNGFPPDNDPNDPRNRQIINRNHRQSNFRNLFYGWRLDYFLVGLLGLVFVLIVIFLAASAINFLGDVASNFTFYIERLFRNAGFRSPNELGNFFKLALIAIFIGWAINRFRGRK